jgi:hypothetical protein
MSFNRRGGPDRRPDRFQRPDRDRGDRPDRGPRPEGGGDWQQRDRGPGGGRPFQPRGDRPYQPRPAGDRPYAPRGGGDRPYTPRPPFDRGADEGAMSIRLDPRRVGVLKRLAGETGMRPGDLVRQWVEERLDAARQGIDTPETATQLTAQLADLVERVAALEAAAGVAAPAEPVTDPEPETREVDAEPAPAASDDGESPASPPAPDDTPAGAPPEPEPAAEAPKRARRVSAAPSGGRVALHDEMIAVIRERGPMTAGELATVIAERGRYQPPRSGKPLDAAMVSQRVSNPVYRARFTRDDGRIGLAEGAE